MAAPTREPKVVVPRGSSNNMIGMTATSRSNRVGSCYRFFTIARSAHSVAFRGVGAKSRAVHSGTGRVARVPLDPNHAREGSAADEAFGPVRKTFGFARRGQRL